MSEQPEALRLAEHLELNATHQRGDDRHLAAAELRRLHEENVYLRDVYESLVQDRNELFDDLDKAIAAEREACAKVCEKMADNIYSNSHEDSQPMPHAVAKFCAAAIRARGEQEQPR